MIDRKTILLEDARSRLNSKTPLKWDCGSLCSAECCKGDKSTGMLLFPGEEKLLADSGFELIRVGAGGKERFLAVCAGKCRRRERPLSCRIFPLFPFVYEQRGEVKLRVIFDPRARGICPLAREQTKLSPRFVRNVGLCAKLLMQDYDCLAFLLEQSREIEETLLIAQRLIGR